MKLEKIPLGKISGPDLDVRAQLDLEKLRELAESIEAIGLLQPITVRPAGDGYEVIAGNRRRLACKQLQMAEIPCIVLEEGESADAVGMRLHENLIRADLTPVEEAAVYAEMFERVGDLEAVARMVHRSLGVVEDRLSLLSGDEKVRDALHLGQISTGVAMELNRVQDPGTRAYLLDHAIKSGATVATAAAWRREYAQIRLSEINTAEAPAAPGASVGPDREVYRCWLCGSDEDPHDMRVRMVHQSCERVYARQAEAARARQQQTQPDG